MPSFRGFSALVGLGPECSERDTGRLLVRNTTNLRRYHDKLASLGGSMLMRYIGMELALPEVAHIFVEDCTMQIGVETSRAVENKRVFVVDDDDITRAVAQFMLQDDNETHDLANMAEAYVKAERGLPDLLLLGLSIIEAGGPELVRSIADRWPGTRILIIADTAEDAAANAYLKAGAHGVLAKPFTVESIRRKVDVQLGRIVPSLIQLQLVPASAR